jgi:predicted Zn finger-like uncharacterized protein
MALATRCNQCGTVFRVVQDQLRVSEGWVRCGRCSAVFNAALELFDLDNGSPVSLPPAPMPHGPPVEPPTPAWRSATPLPAPAVRGSETLDDRVDDDVFEEAFDVPERAPFEPAVAEPPAEPEPQHADTSADRLPPASALLDPLADGVGPAAIVADAAIVAHAGPEPLASGAPLQVDPDETLAAPSFMRTAERDAFWRRPSVRAGLLGSAVLLALLLAAQVGVAWRDPLAASVPAARPLLEALCSAAGCTISPLRHIERLSVDSSGLSRLEGTPLYKLSLLLRSRADTALLAPALELSLTDSQGRLVLRRVLQGAELGLRSPVIDAGQELPLQLLLSVGETRVTGYTVELFYP